MAETKVFGLKVSGDDVPALYIGFLGLGDEINEAVRDRAADDITKDDLPPGYDSLTIHDLPVPGEGERFTTPPVYIGGYSAIPLSEAEGA